jgi:hypothetical protein
MNNNNKFNVTINEESLESQHQNVHFSDQTPQWDYTVDSMPDPTFNIADTDDASLGNFFSRPIKIQSYSWATGTTLFEKFNPWQDFFENPRVLNRITNYNLLRCKLKVRIVLNGNSFHYGRAIASYLPLHNFDEFTKDRTHLIQDVVAASQRPHVYLDPTTNQGGTLTLPFCWYSNAMKIPDQDWREMGTMIIHGMQDLKHANGATDQVIVSVFAWAEDVSLSIPTANEPSALVPQMGEIFVPQVNDEYGSGPISRPAAVVARAAGALKNMPGIGVYARATEMAANAVSSVASMFGYSRPVELADIVPYKPTLLGNMSNTNVPDTSQKLTLDAKQELTVDPRVMGLGDADEMTIKSIAQRESFLTQFGWAVADPTETLLWNTEVSPVLWSTVPGTVDEIHMPACCFAALPFSKWRGTVKFRFQIVASTFHKGRLKITYDPSLPLTNEYNTNYTYIIDLAKERDFTVDIGWGQEKSMVGHRHPGQNSEPYDTIAIATDPGINANGILSVYVVNDLTVPNSIANNDIEVNVFVSVGDDFEVFEPDSRNIEDLVWFEPQMGEIFTPQMAETTDSSLNHPDADLTKHEDEPMKMDSSSSMAPTLSQQDHTSCVYFGDPITSFRQCLKRYNYHSAMSLASVTTSPTLMTVRNSNFPYYRGYAPGAVHFTSVPGPTTPYNFCKMTLLNYITPAYTCRRGGLRWKYHRTGGLTNDTALMMVCRDSTSGNGYTQDETTLITQGTGSLYARVRELAMEMPHTWDGAVATSTRQNPVVEAELPFYSVDRFALGKQADMTSSNNVFRDFHTLTTIWECEATDSCSIHCFTSVGEDFTLGFFTGAPVAWRVTQQSDPPAV